MIHRLEEQETQEVRKFCKHVEREQESKRLVLLMARVKRQLDTLQVPPPKAA